MKTSQAGKHRPDLSALCLGCMGVSRFCKGGIGCVAYAPLGRGFLIGRYADTSAANR